MSFNSIIKSQLLTKNIIQNDKIVLFLNYSNINTDELFFIRTLLKSNDLTLIRLQLKYFNKLVKSIIINDVVYKKEFKNYDLRVINLCSISFNNFLIFFFILNILNSKYLEKINYIFVKNFNLFIKYEFLHNLLLKTLNTNFLDNKLGNFIEYKSTFNFYVLKLYLFNKIILYKLVFLIKFLLVLKFHDKFYQLLKK